MATRGADTLIEHPRARETKAEADIAKVLTFDEARRIAVNLTKLPEFLGAGWRRVG